MVQRGVSIMKATKASLGVLWAWFRLPTLLLLVLVALYR